MRNMLIPILLTDNVLLKQDGPASSVRSLVSASIPSNDAIKLFRKNITPRSAIPSDLPHQQ